MTRTRVVVTTLTEEEYGRVKLFGRKAQIAEDNALRLLILDGLSMTDDDRLPEGLVNDVSIRALPGLLPKVATTMENAGVRMVSQLLLMKSREWEKIPGIGKAYRKHIDKLLGRGILPDA